MGVALTEWRGVADGDQLVTNVAVDYLVIDRPMGAPASDLEAALNAAGAQGWWLLQSLMIQFNTRRRMFKQVGGVVEYLVRDAEVGRTPAETEAALDARGRDGWELNQLYMTTKNIRRAVYARGGAGGGGGGGGIPEAPLDDITYGRRNAAWNRAIAADNDVMDGGNF